jgi:hypothetical protein
VGHVVASLVSNQTGVLSALCLGMLGEGVEVCFRQLAAKLKKHANVVHMRN